MTREKAKQPLIRVIFGLLVIVAAIIAVAVLICRVSDYLLHTAYLPRLGETAVVDEIEISQQQALSECPDIEITDYDKEFMDKLITDPMFLDLEADADKVNDFREIEITADEAGFERYAPFPDENYTINIEYSANEIMPSHAYVNLEYTDGSNVRKMFMYIDKGDEHSDGENRYTKAITVRNSDGKYISRYWCSYGEYRKETFKYGLVSYAEKIFNAMMSV